VGDFYSDILSPKAQADGQMAAVQTRQALMISRPDTGPVRRARGGMGRPIRFQPSQSLPGKWRRIRLEVEPSGLRALWAADPAGPLVPLATVPAAELETLYTDTRQDLARQTPGASLDASPWRPRLPFGVWCGHAAVAVRNVVVEPLP
jgi:hypothetical protein